MSQDSTQKPAPAFTDLNPSSYSIRYMVVVVPLGDECICEQLENNELCLQETNRSCCLCGTPTYYTHEQKPYERCFVHTSKPGPGGGTCCVCQQCATLSRNVQEALYQFRRTLNGEENHGNGNG